jgi:WhiB family transcriptional regulator, redox-sensing transcriptional regulator
MTQGLCKTLSISPNVFFPEIGRRPTVTVVAKQVCTACHVHDECLHYAIVNNIKDGIWGGTTKQERKKLRRQRIMLDRSA